MTAVITGAGTGVGRAAAVALAAAGHDIVLAGRRSEPLAEVGGEVRRAGRVAIEVPTDVADADAVRALFDAGVDSFGRIDLLFNNAGTGAAPVPIDELSVEAWRHVVDINLTGSFLCAREAFRIMRSQDPRGGRIINNGSISAHTPRPLSTPYTATKHAITGLTRSLALDGRELGITCGQIDIGNAQTPMTQPMADGVRQADGSIRSEPTMDVSVVAEAVVYMAGLPADANVLFMTVMANEMPFVGRG